MAFMKATEFLAMMDARDKAKRGEVLTAEETLLLVNHPEPKNDLICACGCGEPLGFSGSPEFTIDGKFAKPDHWYDKMGDELEKYPILPPRLRRRMRSNESSTS